MLKLPTQAFVREWLSYDSKTGEFVWIKEPRIVSPKLGLVAGGVNNLGYWLIKLPGFSQLGAHRLAWIYMHGLTIGGGEIDHIDGDRRNNAIANLRIATRLQQTMNKCVQSNNRTGLKGAYYHAAHRGKKWRSQIKVDGKYIFLGCFQTAEEAHAAYGVAAVKYYGEFARVA